MSFPRYESYKDSGIEWLGEVPQHWKICILKRLLAESLMYGANEASDDDTPSNPRFVRITDIDTDGNLREDTFRSLPFEVAEPYFLTDGDILLARSGATVGKSFIYRTSWGVCCFAGYLIRARLNRDAMSPDYLYACCQSSFYWQYINSDQIQATIQNFSAERYGNFVLPLPPVPEQKTIAAFLDRETAKIDALIAEQQRLIELLKEKRQAVISHAVTKGLNPNAAMKDSGIEWLGEVPEHWDIKRLKHIKALSPNAFVDGPFGSNLKSEHFIDDGDAYVIESNFATQGRLETLGLKTITSEHFETIRRSETRAGDIVIAKIGAQFGKASILPSIDKPAVVSGNSMKLTANNNICETLWAYWQLFNLKANGEIDLLVNGSAQPALSLGAMNELVFLLPSIKEQREITLFLDRETAKLNDLTAEAENAIDLLQERRTALISAAVTGKIDVRDLVATKPEVGQAA